MTRGENVAAGTVLVRIDNPENIAERERRSQASSRRRPACRRQCGTRAEMIAARKAALERRGEHGPYAKTSSSRPVRQHGNAPQARSKPVTITCIKVSARPINEIRL